MHAVMMTSTPEFYWTDKTMELLGMYMVEKFGFAGLLHY